MTQKEFELKLKIIKARARVIVMQQAPVRSGHLMRHIQVGSSEVDDVWYIWIRIDEDDVPYARDTTRVWPASRASGRQNPNEGWWDQAHQAVARMAAGVLGAKVQ